MNTSIFSITTRDAVESGMLVPVDSKTSKEAGIKFPVFVSAGVWNRYAKVPVELVKFQTEEGRLWDMLYLFGLTVQIPNAPKFNFTFSCEMGLDLDFIASEAASKVGARHRDVTLSTTISKLDIDYPVPAFYILLPEEDQHRT